MTQTDQAAETSGPADVARELLASLVRTAAPRLGRVAVARIAGPLTDAVVEMRAAALAEADGWHQVAAALGAADSTDPASAMAALMERNRRDLERHGADDKTRNVLDSVRHLAQRWADYGPQARKGWTGEAFPTVVDGLDNLLLEHQRFAAAESPVQRDELIETPERLEQVPETALIRDADSITFEKTGPLDDDTDVWAMPGGEGRFRPSLPVRVLDLGIGGAK